MATEEMLRIPSSSKEFLPVAVASDEDPTGNSVYIAITVDDLTEPQPDDWHQGSWSNSQKFVYIDGKYQKAWVAKILISGTDNGGMIELAEGTWEAWAKFSDGTQIIVRPAGKFQVT